MAMRFIAEQGREISTGVPVAFTARLDLENNKV